MTYEFVSAMVGRPGYAVRMSGRNDVRFDRVGLPAFRFSDTNGWSEIAPDRNGMRARTQVTGNGPKGKTHLVIQKGRFFLEAHAVHPALPGERPTTVVEMTPGAAKAAWADERAELSAILGTDLIGTGAQRAKRETQPSPTALSRHAQPTKVASQHPVQREVTV